MVEILDRPVPSGNRAGHSPHSVLVVGHQTKKIHGLRYGFKVVSAPPILVDPGREPGFPWMSRRVGDRRDGKLEIFLVKPDRRFAHKIRECVAVGPADVFEVQLEADVAILFARADQGRNGLLPRLSIREKLVNFFLCESAVHNQGHYRNVVLARNFQHLWVWPAGNQAARVHGIPVGREYVDFIRMRQERPYGLGLPRHVENGLGLLGASGHYGKEKCRDDGQEYLYLLHGRSLATPSHQSQHGNTSPRVHGGLASALSAADRPGHAIGPLPRGNARTDFQRLQIQHRDGIPPRNGNIRPRSIGKDQNAFRLAPRLNRLISFRELASRTSTSLPAKSETSTIFPSGVNL